MSRPTNATAAGPERRGLAEPLDEVDGQILADDARTPSVPKYRRKPGLSLGELRRLAGLVETGFLALDDAGVAGENPSR